MLTGAISASTFNGFSRLTVNERPISPAALLGKKVSVRISKSILKTYKVVLSRSSKNYGIDIFLNVDGKLCSAAEFVSSGMGKIEKIL